MVAMFLPIQFYKILQVSTILHMLQLIFLSQVIFMFRLLLGKVMYANAVGTNEK